MTFGAPLLDSACSKPSNSQAAHGHDATNHRAGYAEVPGNRPQYSGIRRALPRLLSPRTHVRAGNLARASHEEWFRWRRHVVKGCDAGEERPAARHHERVADPVRREAGSAA